MNKDFIGIIGTGYWGKNLLRNMNNLNVLHGFYEENKKTREKISLLYKNVKAYKSLEAFLNDKNIKAVCIATPAVTHAEIGFKALKAGKHVFIEKPMCLYIQEGEKLIELANKLDLKIMVGHLLLYHPAFKALSKYVKENKLGKLRYLYSSRLSLGKFRKEENALWSFAPHDISMILNLVEEIPIEVNAFGGNYLNDNIADTTITTLKFHNNIRAHIFVSWLHPYKDQRLVVIGDKAMAVFQDSVIGSEKLMIYKHKAKWDGELPLIEKALGKAIPYDEKIEPLKAECEAFINLVKYNKAVPSDANEGLSVLKVLKDADKCLK